LVVSYLRLVESWIWSKPTIAIATLPLDQSVLVFNPEAFNPEAFNPEGFQSRRLSIPKAFNPEGIAPQSPGLAPAFWRQPWVQAGIFVSTPTGLRPSF